jgi:hypothetical protein
LNVLPSPQIWTSPFMPRTSIVPVTARPIGVVLSAASGRRNVERAGLERRQSSWRAARGNRSTALSPLHCSALRDLVVIGLIGLAEMAGA